jgi:ssDNA-binding Zn-finger/Zn-ribbon topoisomerase 1
VDDDIEISDDKPNDKFTYNPEAEIVAPVCPKCGGELIQRAATKGQYAGQKFWGCSNFPKCKFTKKSCLRCGESLFLEDRNARLAADI